MTEYQEKIIELLKSYPHLQSQLKLLRYELSQKAVIDPESVIEGMALSSARFGVQRGGGHISDKTMMIALEYERQFDQLKNDLTAQLVEEIMPLQADLDRIEFYVAMLSEKEAQVIRMYYFESNTWAKLQEKLGITKSTLINRRDAAINKLAKMYGYIESKMSEEDQL